MLDRRDGGSPLLMAARGSWFACSSCCSCCLAGRSAANSHNKLVDPRFWRIWWWQTVAYRGAVASATWLNEQRVAQICLRQWIRLRRPRGSTNYCYKAIGLTTLVESNIKKKKKPLFFFPPWEIHFNCSKLLWSGCPCVSYQKPPLLVQKKGYFLYKEKKLWAFEDRANLQARRENQPRDDIPPCWR